jgi:hypothetical protein
MELTPLKAIDETLEQEFKKGEISAIRLFISLPQTVVDDLEEQITKRELEGEEDEDTGSTVES